MLEDAVRVIGAAVDCPAARVVPLFVQEIVKGPFALVGFQLVVVMLRVNGEPPVFFT